MDIFHNAGGRRPLEILDPDLGSVGKNIDNRANRLTEPDDENVNAERRYKFPRLEPTTQLCADEVRNVRLLPCQGRDELYRNNPDSVPFLGESRREAYKEFGISQNLKNNIISSDAVHDSISNYRLIKPIGMGGFAEVYHATCISGSLVGREVAIKIIPKEKLKKESVLMRVRQEVEIQRQLEHKNIVKFYGCFEDCFSVYLVLELCPYGNLLQYLRARTNQRLPEPEIRHIMIKLIDAMLYLHRLNIVHRDIKCSNILIGDDFQIQLADFGLAIKMDSQNKELSTLCGTMNYISPEVIERRPYTFSSDVWSLGCVLVTLLTGSPPFEGSDSSKLAQRIMNVEYELPAYVSPQAARLVKDMLIRHPEKRIPLKALKSKSFFNPTLSVHPLDNKYFLSKEALPSSHIQPRLPTPPPFQKNGQSRVGSEQGPATACTTPGTSKLTRLDEMAASSPIKGGLEGFQFNTKYLVPFEQVSSHSTLTLLASGRLVLCFKKEHCMTVFSPDGQQLKIYDYSSQLPVSDAFINSLKPLRTYDAAMLPEKYHRRYQYVCHQINKIQCEVAKVEYASEKAFCRLMLNQPHPNFDVVFESGHRIISLASSSKLLISSPQVPSQSGAYKREFDTRDMVCFDLPVDLHAPFLHFQECLKICLQISKMIDTSNNSVDIPFYFNRRHMLNSSSCSEVSKLSPYQDYRIDTWCLQRTQPQPDGLDTRYLQGVGWCCRQNDGDVILLFNDGYRLELYSSPGEVKVYYPPGHLSTSPRLFYISSHLPLEIKERLAHLEGFLHLWESN